MIKDRSKGKLGACVTAAAGTLVLGSTVAPAQDDPPFGDEQSVDYARQLWEALQDAGYVGEEAVRSYAYEGSEPHGVVLEQVEAQLTVDGREDIVIVKSNFMADGLTTEQVMDAPRDEFLDATTVMFKREAGYAPESGDWFWAKYLPGGELDRTPGDVQMAGRVQGCIDCHADASGEDFVFLHDRYAEQ